MVYVMNAYRRGIRKAAALLLILMVIIMSGCQNKEPETKKLKIVTTIFPEYDWVRELIGDNMENIDLILLQNKGTDMHSYQPSVKDMAEISDADLLIYVGGTSDKWIEDAKENKVNKNQVSLNLVESLGEKVKEEKIVEGMEEEKEEEGHDHADYEIDEHIWLSLDNAISICGAIEEKLEVIDEANKEVYKQNLELYEGRLRGLDEAYKTMREDARKDTVVFGDRFPFRYLVDDYNINYFAAFPGCSAETGASFETIVFLAGKVDELNLLDILVLENSDKMVAESINGSTKDKDKTIRELNSMQSVTDKDIENGESYIGIMESNLEVLKKVLN